VGCYGRFGQLVNRHGVEDVPLRLLVWGVTSPSARSQTRDCRRTLIVSSQLHPAMNMSNNATRVTHFITGSLCSCFTFVVIFCCGAGVGVWDLDPGIFDLFIVS
jgi:hypothetical protein